MYLISISILVNLRGTNLRGINLNDANLTGAELIIANLNGANLVRASLIAANLNNAQIESARFGFNLGISEEMKQGLIKQGAIFVDFPGARSGLLSPH